MQWQAYAALHPIGPARDDWRVAQLAALLFNINRGKGMAPAKVSEFMWQTPQDEADPDDEADQLRMFLGSLPEPKVLN
jgi:hypothetical protein